ncbi:MAG: ABC transporter ATP-binding protein/permease [Oxalobacter sp.]|nr:MAG: ABC transporter ATP-binding protein/permease [Oxalobacter sp.]
MRRHLRSHISRTAGLPRNDWSTLQSFLPFLWAFKGRVVATLLFLVCAKVSAMGIPLVLKRLIDALGIRASEPQAIIVLPVSLLFAYGALRLANALFTELRELTFAKVTQRAIRSIALRVFQHLHNLSLRFHLSRQTGGVTRDIERGSRGILSLITYTLYNILPTLVEVALVLGYLLWAYDIWFSVIAAATLAVYVIFTIMVTDWRTHFRRAVNQLDSETNNRAIDSIINYETVKYFGNEAHEASAYDAGLQKVERSALKSQMALSLLNTGQTTIVAIAVTLLLWRATQCVIDGTMTLGDLVLVNAFMIQLYIPLNYLGVIYREIKQSLADMERLFSLMHEQRDVTDVPDAPPLSVRGGEVRFASVSFRYEANRQILFDVDFCIPAGTTTAIVGHSGSGKSTLARLLFRFYDVDDGCIFIDGQDIRNVSQPSLRHAIGIVPQDTVLFNDTIGYNIAYGRPDASQTEIEAAAKAACIHEFIISLPDAYATRVGERGLKLSGGEKQRVAIARTILKDPTILIFDEATSALDTQSEQAIQGQLKEIAKDRTTMVIAHRLSTIVDAQQIIVLDRGGIVERGTHAELLAAGGAYAEMWARQQISQIGSPTSANLSETQARTDENNLPVEIVAGIHIERQ